MAVKRFLPALALLLTACATAAPTPPTVLERPGLTGRALDEGECALFVWTRDAARDLILFSSAEEAALWTYKGENPFEPTESPLAPEQQFEVDDIPYRLALGPGEPFGGGTRYGNGALRSVVDGWDVVQPVLGLTACGQSSD